MKILYLHGIGSGKDTASAENLRRLSEYDVYSPEIPIDPIEAEKFILSIEGEYDLIIGSSLGGFYALLLGDRLKLVINPALFADEDIRDKIGLGIQPFFCDRSDGRTEYEIDETFIEKLKTVRSHICICDNTYGMFADNDELLGHYDDFEKMYGSDKTFRFQGEHRISEKNITEDIIPVIRQLCDKY